MQWARGVCLEGCLPRGVSVWGWQTPPQDQRQTPHGTRGRQPPRNQRHTHTPQRPEADIPYRTRGRHPPMGPEADTPRTRGRHPPVRYYRIQSTSGRYASYWNIFLSLHVEKPATDDVLFLLPKNHGCLQKV